MTSSLTFKVGLTPDWSDWAPGTLEVALAEVLEPLRGLTHEVMPDRGGKATTEIDQYDAIMAFAYPFPGEAFRDIKRLCCIARWGVGFDSVDTAASTASDVAVSLSPGAVQRPMAEGIITLILTLAKNVRRLDSHVRSGRWRENLNCHSICVRGRTLGSVGLGNIAGEMFKMAKGMSFGRLLAFDPYAAADRASALGVELVPLETMLRESDFVTVNAPLNDQTRGIIAARELSMMKPGAYLVNTSRGPLVHEASLIAALRDRRIAGAGLDVFESEPMPPGHPYYEMDNVILTPHSVGWTEELIHDLNFETCRSVRAIYEGRIPANLANPAVATRPGLEEKLAKWRSK